MKQKSVSAAAFFVLLALTTASAYGGPLAGGATQQGALQDMEKNLSDLGDLVVLDGSDAKHYSSNLQDLVGQYYQIVTVRGQKSLQLLGRATEDLKVDKVELKDKILFSKVTDSSYSAGLNIPWLNEEQQ